MLGQTPQYEWRWWWVSLWGITKICWYAQACFNSLGISIFYHQMVTSSFKQNALNYLCVVIEQYYTVIHLPPMLLQPSTPWTSCSLGSEYHKPLTLLFLRSRIWSGHSEADEAGNRARDRRSIISTGRVWCYLSSWGLLGYLQWLGEIRFMSENILLGD